MTWWDNSIWVTFVNTPSLHHTSNFHVSIFPFISLTIHILSLPNTYRHIPRSSHHCFSSILPFFPFPFRHTHTHTRAFSTVLNLPVIYTIFASCHPCPPTPAHTLRETIVYTLPFLCLLSLCSKPPYSPLSFPFTCSHALHPFKLIKS